MELVLVLLRQMIVMFLLMVVGYWLFKTGRVSLQGNKELGTVLLYVILPCAIVNSYISVDFSREKTIGLFWSFVAAVLSLGTAMLVSRLFFEKRNKIEHFGTAFSNAGFMGIPIVQAVIGVEAVFYVAAFVALLNVLQWTYGVIVMSEKKDAISVKRLVTNPIVISMVVGVVVYLLRMPVPSVVRLAVSYLAGMNAPVAMVIMGVFLAQLTVKDLFTEKYAYLSSLLRLVVIPLLTIVVLSPIPRQYRDIRMATFIAACAPVGSNVAIFAQLNQLDYGRAVKSVCLSTVFSILTMPTMVGIARMVWE